MLLILMSDGRWLLNGAGSSTMENVLGQKIHGRDDLAVVPPFFLLSSQVTKSTFQAAHESAVGLVLRDFL